MRSGKIKIVIPENPDEFKAMEEIQKDAWNAEDITITPAHVLRAAQMANNCVYLAYVEDEPVGYVYGFFGFHDGKLYLHSHQVGVKRRYQNMGIGFLLKLKQREFAISRKIDLIRWTFDPLQSKNAYFNFAKLGAINREYIQNLYGEIKDELNRGIPTDRFYVEWYVFSQRVRDRVEKKVRPPSFEDLEIPLATKTKNLKENMLVLGDYNTSLSEKLLAIEIPVNFTEMKNRDLKIAIDWRIKTRELFIKYFSRGYIVVDLIRSQDRKRCFYILCRESLEKILSENWWAW